MIYLCTRQLISSACSSDMPEYFVRSEEGLLPRMSLSTFVNRDVLMATAESRGGDRNHWIC